MQSVQVLTAAWYGDREVDLTFPDDWDLNLIAFEERPVLTTRSAATGVPSTDWVTENRRTRAGKEKCCPHRR